MAATANSGRSISADEVDAPYSICPKGWKLPTSRSAVAGNSDFYQLAIAYGMSPGDIGQTSNIFRRQAGSGTIPNLSSGRFSESNNYESAYHYYLSSTSGTDSTRAIGLYFSTPRKTGTVYTGYNVYRRFGGAIRCVAE